MATPLPRRVKDMSAFFDSEDDLNTPCKSSQRNADQTNKENVAQSINNAKNSLLNAPKESGYGFFPMRTRELQMQSDSDEEDEEEGKSDHNLNCAILNDSFIQSPLHENTASTSSLSIPAAALKRTDSNLSFLGRFGNMGINCSGREKSPNAEVEEPAKKGPPPTTLQRKAIETETPLRPLNVAPKSQLKHEAEFVTPQVRCRSIMRGSRQQDLQKSSSAASSSLANEFRSQKVLFQTPMAVSRGAAFPGDSISFSLCDTISESPDTPAQPKPAAVPRTGKSKVSLESAFREAEKLAEVLPPVASAPAPVPPASTPATSSSSTNVLKIKNHEYVIVRKLGCGGSSSVYLARRKDTGEEFALKVVDLQADPAVVEGYLNETKLLAKLQGCVCVVALYDYLLNSRESKLYVVMEKGDSDLNKILQSYTTNLPLYNLMNILYQMLQAVNYIHQNGVIHSDLKPANFLMVNGRLKLIDFGIASNIAVDSTSIIKFSPAGTFNYISPEALTDISTGSSPMRNNQPKMKISTKSDVWSLGCILYLLLYQKTPFGHIRNINAKMSAISSPSTSIDYPAIPVYYPIMLVHMTKNCLQLEPKKRPSCADLLQYPFHMVIPIQNLALTAKR
ncbi:dual specificity protein kinase Ttk [Scaptodrosophila lebanonensis]|uniref:Dual specificity protein kinase Ttk n=1 Tax=Drosophila lebanonensis TaxID=7225 RepID=A0A6J2TB51_DROLE|nr:dual specificity protein kinase Ttk [Scaptodrosophila lebanonensis]